MFSSHELLPIESVLTLLFMELCSMILKVQEILKKKKTHTVASKNDFLTLKFREIPHYIYNLSNHLYYRT